MAWTATDTILVVIAAILFLELVVAVLMGLRARKLLADLQQTAVMVNDLRPRLERLLDDADGELQEVRNLNLTVNRVLADAEAVTDQASSLLVKGMQVVETVRIPARCHAIVEGVKAGLQAFVTRDGGRAQSERSGMGVGGRRDDD